MKRLEANELRSIDGGKFYFGENDNTGYPCYGFYNLDGFNLHLIINDGILDQFYFSLPGIVGYRITFLNAGFMRTLSFGENWGEA